jgi:hypothetical protein
MRAGLVSQCLSAATDLCLHKDPIYLSEYLGYSLFLPPPPSDPCLPRGLTAKQTGTDALERNKQTITGKTFIFAALFFCFGLLKRKSALPDKQATIAVIHRETQLEQSCKTLNTFFFINLRLQMTNYI